MPIQFPDFQRISFDEANPMLVGAERGQKFTQSAMQFPQDLKAKMLANEIAQVQAKYAEPMAQGNLTSLNQANQWNPKIWGSEINLRGAQAGQAGAETNKINYMLKNPGLLGGDITKSLEALRLMHLVNDQYQSNQPPAQSQTAPVQMPQAPQPQQAPMPSALQNAIGQQQFPNTPTQPPQNFMGGNNPATAPIAPNPLSSALQQGQPPRQNGFDINGMVQALINKPATDNNYKQVLTATMQQNLQSKPYQQMPSVEKEFAISQARAFGYTGDEANRYLSKGATLKDMAAAKGLDPNDPSSWPMAKGAPTTAIQTRIQRGNSTLAALNAVEPEIAASYNQYAPRFKNVSPKLIADMVSGENPDQQADALAAYALYPELSALRINAMGGNVGEGAIQHMADAAFQRLNTLGISPNSEVYQKVQKRVSQLINKMNHAENKSIFGQQQQSYEDDDRAANAGANSDLASMSDADLARIAAGGE
jgi:hypothetical protein